MFRIVFMACVFVCVAAEGRAEVCESRKYPGLVMDTETMRNAEAFLDEVLSKYALSINNSFRSYGEQEQLYRAWVANGRKGNPAARPGMSRHESGFALDLNGLQGLTFNEWNNVLNAGERYGFEYILGDWPGEGSREFDWPHFESDPRSYGKTLAQAIALNRIDRQSIGPCPWKTELSAEEKAYFGQIIVTEARLHAASNGTSTEFAGQLTNHGSGIVCQVELRLEFRDALDDVNLVRILHPVSLLTTSLKSGGTRPFRFELGALPEYRHKQHIAVLVTYLTLLCYISRHSSPSGCPSQPLIRWVSQQLLHKFAMDPGWPAFSPLPPRQRAGVNAQPLGQRRLGDPTSLAVAGELRAKRLRLWQGVIPKESGNRRNCKQRRGVSLPLPIDHGGLRHPHEVCRLFLSEVEVKPTFANMVSHRIDLLGIKR